MKAVGKWSESLVFWFKLREAVWSSIKAVLSTFGLGLDDLSEIFYEETLSESIDIETTGVVTCFFDKHEPITS